MLKEAKYNAPRIGKKRWSTKYKKKINCSNPRGFSQKQYCKRKRRGGSYKSSFEIISSLIKLANNLDLKKLYSEADVVDKIITKIAKKKSKFSSEILEIAEKDQRLRSLWKELVEGNGGWNMSDEKMNLLRKDFANTYDTKIDSLFGDEEGQRKFLEMMEQGFDWESFSKEDWKNIFFITQHFDSRRDVQRDMLKVFKKYLGEESQIFKYLSDRISCAESGKQKYDTQNICEAKKIILKKRSV